MSYASTSWSTAAVVEVIWANREPVSKGGIGDDDVDDDDVDDDDDDDGADDDGDQMSYTEIYYVTFCNQEEEYREQSSEILFPGVGLSLTGTNGPLSTMPTSQRWQILPQISPF